jgi:protein SCO1/2
MKTRKFIAILMVIILPLGSYLLVNSFSKDAVLMPKRYFYDTVLSVNRDGKTLQDTQWHKVKSFTLTNQFGKEVSLDELPGKIIIADFFFTSCPSICPTLTRNMKRLQDAFVKTDTIVRFVSFTVDPERDSAQRLKAYGDKYRINHDTWWMLTGPKKDIYDIALHEFKANIAQEEGVDTGFIHTDKLFLLDKDRVVRGWYNGLDSVNLDRLIRDVVFLNMERDKKVKRNLFRK